MTVMGDPGVIGARLPALVVALALVAGCGDDGADSASDAGTTSTTQPDAEPVDEDVEAKLDEVVDVLYAENRAVCEALGPPTPDADHPDVLATATGPVLERLEELAEEFREEGLAFHCPEDSRYEIEVLSYEFGEFDGDEAAWLEVCAVDDGQRVVVATGESLTPADVTAVHSSDALRRVDGQWMLAERRVNEEWEGEDECDID